MNNTIDFVLRMRDMLSSNLTKVGSTSQSTFSKMSQSADNMTGRNKILGMSFNELQSKIKEVESVISKSTVPSQIAAARRELAALQRQSANHIGNTNSSSGSSSSGIGLGGIAMGTMIGGMATAGLSMAAGAIKAGVSEMISKSFEKEQAITGLTTFLGKKGATDAYKNIRKDANDTPFDTAALLEVNRSLISAGLNAKTARADTLNLANAVSAVGGGNDILSRMAANMQQIKTVGKATAMDIRQFGIAGINIYEMLARSTGKNIAQVKEMDVTYEQLQKALAMSAGKGGIYEGALQAQGATKSGKWNTFKDNVVTGLSDIGDAFSPVILKLLDLGIKFANNITPMLERTKPYIDGFANGFGRVIDYVTTIKDTTGGWADYLATAENNFSNMWEFAKKIGVQLWSLVSSIVDFVKNSEILKDVFRMQGWIMEKTFKIIGWLFDKLIWLWENVLKPILQAVDSVWKWIKGGEATVKIKVSSLNKPKPKTDDPNSPIGTGASLMASNNNSSKTAGDTVSGAGPKVVNIHVGKFFDNINFTTMNSTESATEVEKVVLECLARVLYNGAKTV
ncbi:tape measure protein [Flavobacterium gilvum]|uniref:Uncharacterized protein n=1 Tax=Flavobacterium gilvum TaxID=1492737 RepID=A0AAC9N5C4_9FLAO|nr:tape measure protein [Flavobacterium gilvum]AOW09521.1 hypothetical protein EM308_08415 [Flavobacterium gilvum]KFC60028.1 hypothetical protein FEM08_12070 [Flavobacterium gilvum]